MGETHQYDHLHPHHQAAAPPAGAATSSRVGMRRTAGPGEIVEVQGGHIVRSTGRKDRHSKVCTAKGPRDRRVRLSAQTAIQFYDVQDRLGCDRPSKAVDWLIKKAKTAIDKLAELPAWKPTTTATSNAATTATKARPAGQQKQQEEDETHNNDKQQGSGGSSEREYNPPVDSFQITFQQHHQINPGSGFLPPSLDSDAIADTIKSFFPMGSAAGGGDSNPAPSLSSFQNYPVPDLLSRTSSSGHNQDLRLSLQSFQEPIIGHQHEQNHHHQVLFSGPAAAHYIGFDGSSSFGGGWSEHPQQQHQNPAEIARFQRMVASWSASGSGAGADSTVGSGGGGFIFNSIPLAQHPPQTVLSPVQVAPQLVQPMLFGQNQLLISQRGPLQSSNTPSVRAWIDTADQIPQIHPGMGYSAGGGFSGFRVPARIQGDEEEHDGIPNKPSSASSDSRH